MPLYYDNPAAPFVSEAERTWTEWKIPLADLGGVSLDAIKKMILGIGNPDVPTPDGSGVVFYDDIRVVKPAPVEDPSEAAAE